MTVAFGLVLVGIFLPLMMLVADYGLIMYERSELQNSADVGAFAAAFDCARAPAAVNCSTTVALHPIAQVDAQSYANKNSHEDRTIPGNPLDANSSTLPLDFSVPGRVTVTTQSKEKGKDSISLWVAGWMNPSWSRAQSQASATAAWGGRGNAETIPFIVPESLGAEDPCPLDSQPFRSWNCALDYQRRNFPGYADPVTGLIPERGPFPDDLGQLGPLAARRAPVIVFNGSDHPPGLSGSLNGPGKTQCTVTVEVDPNASPPGAPGNDYNCNESEADFRTHFLNKAIALPLFASHGGGGAGGGYVMDRFEGFRMTGYRFSSAKYPAEAGQNQWESNQAVCMPGGTPGNGPGNSRCIRGWLVALQPVIGPIGNHGGAQSVQLVK